MRIQFLKNVKKTFSIIKNIIYTSFYYVNVGTGNQDLSFSNGLLRIHRFYSKVRNWTKV